MFVKRLFAKEENKQMLWFYNSAVALGQAPPGVTGISSHSHGCLQVLFKKIPKIQTNYKGKMQIAGLFSQTYLPTPDLQIKPLQ